MVKYLFNGKRQNVNVEQEKIRNEEEKKREEGRAEEGEERKKGKMEILMRLEKKERRSPGLGGKKNHNKQKTQLCVSGLSGPE